METELFLLQIPEENLFAYAPAGIRTGWEKLGNNLGELVGKLAGSIAPPTVEAAGAVAKMIPSLMVYSVVTILSAYFFIEDRDRILAFEEAICQTGQKNTASI